VRVAGLNRRLYLDLADDQWRAVEIGAGGWRVIKNPPVRFRRAAGMLALPIPEAGSSIKKLRRFLNVRNKRDFILIVSWLLAALRDRGPYPVLALAGEQGAAKSTLAAVLRGLVDPNSAALRALPREDRDLFIAATNGHMLAFDNVSGLPTWISDTLCRLATGGGFAVRQLYTDRDEVLFDATRPVILNGIEDVVTRPDLADRAILLNLDPIPGNRRRPEKEFWAAFERERPGILGALLNAVSRGLRMRHRTHLKDLPRMADFALWATACETAMCRPGTFANAYSANLSDAVENVIDADPVGSAVGSFMAVRTVWTGTASDLLGALNQEAGETVRKDKTWPATPRGLSGRLRRAAPFLRKIGTEISFDREGRPRTRTITISKAADGAGVQPSASSARSAAGNSSDLGADGRRTNGPGADANPCAADDGADPTVRRDGAETAGADGADGTDAKSSNDSGAGRHGAWSTRL
jgi:hypothetical protein